MQKNNLLTKALILTFSALLVSACSSKGDTQEGEMQQTATEQGQEGMQVEDDATLSEQADLAKQALLEKSTFYFEFDRSDLKADAKNTLKAHAEYLANKPSGTVVVEGHTDERGTVEYNLALGERRANAIRNFLLANGATAEQIETVSYGEERPAVTGNDESAYSQNRRAVIVYQDQL